MQTEGIKSKGKKKAAYNPPGKFPKSLWFDLSRKEEWEAMAKKEGKTLAAFIQDHVGDLQELETYVKNLKEQEETNRMELDLSQQSTKIHKTGQIYAFSKVLEFIEALKTKHDHNSQSKRANRRARDGKGNPILSKKD